MTGWSTDQSKTANLRIVDSQKKIKTHQLGINRICRPDVAIALGINDNENCDYGFIICLEINAIKEQMKVKIGNSEFPWQASNLQNESFAKVGNIFVENCNYMLTSSSRLAEMLNGEIGLGLKHVWKEKAIKYQYKPVNATQQFSTESTLVVLLNSNRDIARLQLWRLSREKAIQTGAVNVVICVDGPGCLNDGPSLAEWLQENGSIFGYSFRLWPSKPASLPWSKILLDMINDIKSEWLVIIDSQTIAAEGDWIKQLTNEIKSDSHQKKAIMPLILDSNNIQQSQGALLAESNLLKKEKGDLNKIAKSAVRIKTAPLIRLTNENVQSQPYNTKRSWLRFIDYWLMQSQ